MEEPKTGTPVEKKKRTSKRKANAPEPKLETMLRAAADKLRGHMDAAEYKHVVLGLISLKYMSDAFEEHRRDLEAQVSDPANELYIDKPLDHATPWSAAAWRRFVMSMNRIESLTERCQATALLQRGYATLEDRDEYTAANILEARWAFLQGKAKQPTIGKLIDDAMVAIERDNPSLKSVLPKYYARLTLDKQQLGELIDLIGSITTTLFRS